MLDDTESYKMSQSNKTLYRVIDHNERCDITYNSNINIGNRKKNVTKFLPQIENICNLSATCDIKLESALRIASQYGWVLTEIQQKVRQNEETFPLSMFLVQEEDKEEIPMRPLVDFIVKYQQKYEETGIFLDEDKGDGQYLWEGIWEIVRQQHFPNSLSRLKSCFAFKNKIDAENFKNEYDKKDNIIAEIELRNAIIEEYDMQWITDVPIISKMQEATILAYKYWNKEQTSHPITEILINGEYTFKSCQRDKPCYENEIAKKMHEV